MHLQDRTWLERFTLVGVLPCVAGMVNAAGLLELGHATSHTTGNVTWAALSLAGGQAAAARQVATLVGCFFLGALLAAMLVDGGLVTGRRRYAAAFLLEAGVLAGYSWLSVAPVGRASPASLAATLSVAMGLQNALLTRLSGAVVRTTHLTGVVTDLAIGTVRVLRLVRARVLRGADGPLWDEPDLLRLRLHAALLGAFFAGALLIPQGVHALGPLWTAVPILLLLCLLGLDVVKGIGRVSPRVG